MDFRIIVRYRMLGWSIEDGCIIERRKELTSMKKNCWEFKKCGLDAWNMKGSSCPVLNEARLHGTHEGTNAGRACWVVQGTQCNGKVQGTFAQKYMTCSRCDFYQEVQKQESQKFEPTSKLWERLSGC